MTVKLLDCLLIKQEIAIEKVSSVAELKETAKKGEVSPSVIVYDIASHKKGEGLLCEPLKEYPLYGETPRVILSTFKMECDACAEYKAGRCAHYQKPFKVKEVSATVKNFVDEADA